MKGRPAERRRSALPALLRREGLLTRMLLQPAWAISLEVVALIVLVLLGIAVPIANRATADRREQNDARLMQLALAAAAVVDGDLHETIREPEQVSSETYLAMLGPLARFQNTLAGVRNVYSTREDGGRLRFVLDTARSPELLLPTDPPAPALSLLEFDPGREPEMLPTLRAGRAYVDRMTYDTEFSTRLLRSVQAPIRNRQGQVVAFLSLDFDEAYYSDMDVAGRRVFQWSMLSITLLFVVTAAGVVYWLRRRVGESLKALDRELKTDALTGLYNRRHFNRCLAIEVQRAAGRGSALSLLVFDADHFKRVNDTHGHPAGDVVLVRIADCLRAAIRYPQRAFRIGGEEFAVLLPGLGAPQAMELYRELNRGIRQPLAVDAARLEITISGGIAEMKREESGEQLLSRADQAMYIAKNGGRDFAVVAAAV